MEGVFQKIEKLVSETSQVKHSETPKKIKLSYPIQKKAEAFLATLEFQTEPKMIKDLKQKTEKIPEIMRFLLIKKELPKKEEAPEAKPGKPKTKKPLKEKERVSPTQKVALEEIEKELEEVLDFSREGKPQAKPER